VKGVSKDIIVHTDAAQSIGKIPVNVADLAVDLLTIVSQKMYGPKGIGMLFNQTVIEGLITRHYRSLVYSQRHQGGETDTRRRSRAGITTRN